MKPPPGLRVTTVPSLTLEHRSRGVWNVVAVVANLAVALGLGALLMQQRTLTGSWRLALDWFLVGATFVLLLSCWSTLRKLLGRAIVRVEAGTVTFVRGKQVRSFDSAQIVRVFSAPSAHGVRPPCCVMLQLRDGTRTFLLGGLLPNEAHFIEKQLEHTLQLTQGPTSDERRGGALPRPSPVRKAFGSLVVPLLAGALGFFGVKACGTTLAVVALTDFDAAVEVEITAPRDGRIDFWVDVELGGRWVESRRRIGDRYHRFVEDLPHVIDIAVELEQGSRVVAALRCNPFDVSLMTSSHSSETWRFDGAIRGCSVHVPEGGDLHVRIAMEPVGADDDIEIRELRILAKL